MGSDQLGHTMTHFALILSLFGGAFVLNNPYAGLTNVYRVIIHNHTTESDGSYTPTEVGDYFHSQSVDAYGLSDHNTYTPSPGVSGILFIPGEEVTHPVGHVGSLFCPHTVPMNDDPQIPINTIRGYGGIAVMNHPNWAGASWSTNKLHNVTNYNAVEIYSGDSPGVFSEDKWDYVLSTLGRRVWGLSGADLHAVLYTNLFNLVYANELTENALSNSFLTGAVIACTNLPMSVSVFGLTVTATTPSAATFAWVGPNFTTNRLTDSVTTDSYVVSTNEVYIRVKASIGDNTAYSQPFYVEWNNARVGGTVVRAGTLRGK